MTARRRSRSIPRPVLLAAGLLLAFCLMLAVLHVFGWLLATGLIAAGAYAVGQRRGRDAGALAAETIAAERDQLAREYAALRRQLAERSRAAERPQPARPGAVEAAVCREVAAGLVNLGWPARDAKTAASAALSAVQADSARPVNTATVLRQALASAGKNRSQVIPAP